MIHQSRSIVNRTADVASGYVAFPFPPISRKVPPSFGRLRWADLRASWWPLSSAASCDESDVFLSLLRTRTLICRSKVGADRFFLEATTRNRFPFAFWGGNRCGVIFGGIGKEWSHFFPSLCRGIRVPTEMLVGHQSWMGTRTRLWSVLGWEWKP